MTFDGQTANFITQFDAYTICFNLAVPVGPGSTWAITRQPAWMATMLSVPQGGVF